MLFCDVCFMLSFLQFFVILNLCTVQLNHIVVRFVCWFMIRLRVLVLCIVVIFQILILYWRLVCLVSCFQKTTLEVCGRKSYVERTSSVGFESWRRRRIFVGNIRVWHHKECVYTTALIGIIFQFVIFPSMRKTRDSQPFFWSDWLLTDVFFSLTKLFIEVVSYN